MHSPNFVDQNIEKLASLFPNCVTEAKNSQGELTKAIDFDLLKQELSTHIVEGPQERYQLNWPGKREALLTANAPIAKTLRPCREESVNFDTTQNLFIEGDNLDALKLLQETYLGKVKMIYIDPPYNTGNDFIYEDDFAEDTESYKLRSNEKDEEGNHLIANTESNGRFHSDWISMLFSRLKLAKNMLTSDGVIFLSIDDHEYVNLYRICSEIFGESNYCGTFVWKRRSGSMDSTNGISSDHEYVLAFGKENSILKGLERTFEGYSNEDNDPRGPWKKDNLSAGKPGGDVYYPITDPVTGNEFFPPEGRYWSCNRVTMKNRISEGRVIFPALPTGRPMLKRFKSEAEKLRVPVSTWMISNEKLRVSNSLIAPLNTAATKEVQTLFGKKLFPYPKSTKLIESLASQVLDHNSIVLDFFAGSASTAHAIFKMNSVDGGNRRVILVQLPEPLEESTEAWKDGFTDVSQVSRKRLILCGEEIKNCKDNHKNWNQDIGFRVLKVDNSNMSEVYYNPNSISQEDLFNQIDNVKEDRTEEDLLFQVMLDWGVYLHLPIRKETIQGKTVFFVDTNALIACFDKNGAIDEGFVKELCQHKPLRVVFRDAGFADDDVKINVEQIFKQLSPHTDVKSI